MSEIASPQLIQSNEILDLFGNIQIDHSNEVIRTIAKLDFPTGGELRTNEMCFYKVKQLAFDEEYPRREAFENVLWMINRRNIYPRLKLVMP